MAPSNGIFCFLFKDSLNINKAPSIIFLIFNPEIAAGKSPTGENAENLPDKLIKMTEFKNTLEKDLNDICDECKKKDESVSQNLILTGFKICKSCRVSKTIFPI